MAGKTSKHYGNFAKGFADALIAMMKLSMTKDLYEARAQYYRDRGLAARNPKLTAAQQKQAELDAQISQGRTGWGHGAGAGGEGGGGVAGNAGELKDFYVNQGYTPAGASAIVGNWQQENSLRGGGWGGDGGTSAGGLQWHDDPSKGLYRGTGFMNWAHQNNLDVNDPMTSAKYSIVDIKQHFPELDRYLRSTNDVDEATQKFEKDFEGALTPAMGNRLAAARTVYSSTPAATTTKTTKTGGPTAKTAAGAPVQTDDEGRAIDPKTGKPTQAQADLPADKGVQVASLDDTAGLAEYLRLHPEAAAYNAQQQKELDDRQRTLAPPGPDQGGGQGNVNVISSIAQGGRGDTTAPPDETPHGTPLLPPYPLSSRYSPSGNQRPWQETDQPRFPPVQGRELGPENVGQRAWTPDSQPALPPVPGEGPIDPSIIARQAIRARQQGAMPARPQSLDPMPPTAQPMMPPRTPTPVQQMGPEGGGRTTLPPSYDHMPTQQNVPGQVAVGTPTDADKPAPGAQNAGPLMHSTTPRQVTQPSNQAPSTPGYITMERPNLDQAGGGRSGGARQQSQMGMPDLSHLWGPNPPLSQRTPAPASAPASTAQNVPLDRTPMPPMRPPDNFDDVAAGMAVGARRGGPIQRFNRGGIPTRPTTKFAAAGAVPYSTYDANPAPAMGKFNAGAYADPGYQLWRGGLGWLNSQPTSQFTNPATLTVGQEQQNFDALPTNLQTWYNQQNADAMAGGGGGSGNNWYYNPASVPAPPAPAAAAAPAAPAAGPTIVNPPSVQNITNMPASTTITDPTTTTTTGTPGVPNAITAKSYDPNVDAVTGAGFSNTSSTGGTNYSVGAGDKLKTTSDNTISGTDKTILSRRGGPIQRFARGGIPSRPTMKYASAGAVAFAAPGYIGPNLQGGWSGTPESQLAPNQQAWAQTQQNLVDLELQQAHQDNAYWSAGGTNPNPFGSQNAWDQMTVMPSAIWPAAPAAPTPLNEPAPSGQNITAPISNIANIDPTATTTTGTPGVPNVITAKSYDPNVDATTGAGFANTSNTGGTNYSVGSDDTLNQTTPGTISGTGNSTILSRKGGAIPRLPTRVTKRYDMGGGVDQSGDVSPAALGMPPGLGSGGGQQIPPYYYNPATYAGAGAPVGKGVTQTSAPVYNAGAIPSLPMARGGMVAKFDDGGEVAPPANDTADLQNMAYMDMQDERADAQNAPPVEPPTPTSDKDAGWYINPQDTSATQPTATAQPSRDSAPPADPTTPQISDDAGNPSRGLIGAITSGLHWLGEHLGLVGGAQAAGIASDPQTQTNRQNHVNYSPDSATYISHESVAELNDAADHDHQLEGAYRNIAGLEQGYKWALSRGDDATAGRLAASILHYSVITSQNLSVQARHALYNGNMQDAVNKMNEASDAIPDGRLIHATLNNDGTVTVQGKNLNGEVEWQQRGAAATILEHATAMGASGKLQWNALESQAAKYDSTFKDMQTNRRANLIAGGKEDADAAAQKQANDQIAALGPQFDDGATAPPTAPSTAPPALTPVSTPPALPGPGSAPASPETAATAPAPSPGKSPDMTTAQVAAKPIGADGENTGQGPTREAAAVAPAIPNTANVPVAGDQDVDLEHNVAYQQAPALANMNSDGSAKYFTADMRPIVGGRVMVPPKPVSEVVFKSYAPQVQAAYHQREQQYQLAVQENQKLLQADIDGRRRDIAADVTSRRDLSKQTHADTAAGTRNQEQIDAAALLEKNRREDTEKKTQEGWTHEEQKPLSPEDKTFAERSPASYLAANPTTAVYKNDGSLDENASAKALGATFDLKDRGGMRRLDTLSSALYNMRQFNTHVGPQQLGTTLVNMANGTYGYRAKPQTVDHGYGPMREVEVYRGKVGQGTPMRLLIPADDYDAVNGVNNDFVEANKPPTTTDGATLPPPPAPAPPQTGPTTIRPTVPMLQQQPAIPNRPQPSRPLQMPPRVPNEQIPPEWRQQFPELNQ